MMSRTKLWDFRNFHSEAGRRIMQSKRQMRKPPIAINPSIFSLENSTNETVLSYVLRSNEAPKPTKILNKCPAKHPVTARNPKPLRERAGFVKKSSTELPQASRVTEIRVFETPAIFSKELIKSTSRVAAIPIHSNDKSSPGIASKS
eukprot:TRINITY_DN15936_c0_g1_i1.p2 TRINITY_DN15936_c0_g1~~TRINITY_DN15936_c0_g1_i1.p2  ORF type:complete len:147 (-),score=17.68 TRINITY_DN15936_c0_g1_i1:165-605(-)